jgi:flagellar biosynthesis/type III secretory pathway M-ring protein FliF/YscJ
MTDQEVKAEAEEKESIVKKYIRLEDIKWFAAGIVAIIIATVGVQAWADDRIDKKTAPVKAEVKSVKEELTKKIEEVNTKLDKSEEDRKFESRRQDARWEAILNRLNVNDPAPKSKDGGQ